MVDKQKIVDKERMMKQGLSIHCHHNVLIEYCYDYDERVIAIKRDKPENERKIRLRLFKLLPQEAIDELPKRLVKAYAKWRKACAKREKAYAKWRKADAEWEKAYAEWEKAHAERRGRETWHKKFCGCKEWDGEKIVFGGEKLIK